MRRGLTGLTGRKLSVAECEFTRTVQGQINSASPGPAVGIRMERESQLLGLELLVAGDVVRTVALEPTLTNVAVLGVLVVIRTFLTWSLAVEIEGSGPWQAQKDDAHPPADGTRRIASSILPCK